MGTNDDVNGAILESRQRGGRFFVINETTEERYLDGKPSETFANCGEVLTREQRGGHQNCRLLGVLHGLKNGSDSNFRFPKAHIGHDESVHRTRRFHIDLDCVDRLGLIRSQGVGEEVFHFDLPRRVGAEGKPLRNRPLSVEVDEFLGNQVGRRASLGSRLLPFCATHA